MTTKRKPRVDYFPYILILPVVLLILGVIVYPLVNVVRYSLLDYVVTKPNAIKFVGFDNYVKIFTADIAFRKVIWNSFRWVATEVVLQLFFGMIVAMLLNQRFRGRGLIRTINFIPWAISGVLTATIWSLMLNQHIGIASDLFLQLGWSQERIAWLSNRNTVFGSVIVAELWRGIPFFAISILAALQNIPADIYEACRIDGANARQTFRYITFAYIKDTVILTTLLRSVWEFNSVDLIYNLTGGGPARMTSTLSMYIMEQAIKTSNYSYGSTLSVISFCILMLFAIIYLKLGRFSAE